VLHAGTLDVLSWSVTELREPPAGCGPRFAVGWLMRIAQHGFMRRGDGFSAEVRRRTLKQVNALMKLGFDDAQADPGRGGVG
jgi:hypothetical protein